MKQIERRLNQLESKKEAEDNRIKAINFIVFDSKEQKTHPERFRKVMESEEVTDSGVVRRIYNQVRINEPE